MNVTRTRQLTPKALKFYSTTKKLRRIAAQLDRQNTSMVSRLQQAQDFISSKEFLKKKVNTATFRFIDSQLQQQHKRSRGRRFSLDDKMFALSLMKQSPKGYRLLQHTFALPSRKTLMMVIIAFNRRSILKDENLKINIISHRTMLPCHFPV